MAASQAHQLFLQAMMSQGPLASSDTIRLYKDVAKKCGDNADSAAFAGFVSTLNRQLKPLSMEIANARMEDSDVRWYGLVNRTPDNAAKFGTKYALAELEFFNKVMECLISKGDGEASSTSLLNNTTDMERKITAKDAEKFLKTLVKDKWLDEVSPGWYGPGPQFILELRPFLSELFKDDIVNCKLCKEPVIRGQVCGTSRCHVKLHLYCVAKLASGRGSIRCPGCHNNWSHEIPQIDITEGHTT